MPNPESRIPNPESRIPKSPHRLRNPHRYHKAVNAPPSGRAKDGRHRMSLLPRWVRSPRLWVPLRSRAL
ncbi:hypothetical protein BRM01_14060, partial [Xanthomonas oryzae pv. oryzae]